MLKILLFDDRQDSRELIINALLPALGEKGAVQIFVTKAEWGEEGTYEDRLAQHLNTEPNTLASLILADSDLSKTEQFRGLSEPTVRRVAFSMGIPECGYARGDKADEVFIESGKLRESSIRLPFKPTIERFAERVVSVAEGFQFIYDRLPEVKSGSIRQSPGKLLATVLDKPDYADKIALYASGDQNRLAALGQMIGDEETKRKQLTCLLGYWLWDSVLRFPGVTVGKIAASSYLNIKQSVFETDSDVQNVFSVACYTGPFARAKVKMWWRGMLDDMIAEGGYSDGRELASEHLGREIPRSECSEDPSLPAGYYCMLTEKPISLKNSKAGLPWFPRGGDLARVSTSKLDELGPWL